MLAWFLAWKCNCNLKFLNKLKQLKYTQKQPQRLFLFNYVSILTVILHSLRSIITKKKHTISQTYDSILISFQMWDYFF